MANSFSKLLERAKTQLEDGAPGSGDEIVVAVNTQLSEEGQATHMVGGALAPLFGLWGLILAALPFARLAVKAIRNGRDPDDLAEQVHHRIFLLVFRRDRLDVHARKRRNRFGALLTSLPYDDMSYGRGPDPSSMAINTYLRTQDIEFPINGWFERDLRKALGPLGVTIEPLSGATSQIGKQLNSKTTTVEEAS